MKKSLFSASMLFAAAGMIVSCNNAQQSTQDKVKEVRDMVEADLAEGKAEAHQAIQLADSVRGHVVEIFDEIQNERTEIVDGYAKLKKDVAMVPADFLFPVELAEKAQTDYQRCQVLGLLWADKNCDDRVFESRNKSEERNAAIAKLSVETYMLKRLPALKDSNEVALNKIESNVNLITHDNLIDALEHDHADEALVVLTYAVVETVTDVAGVAERLNQYDRTKTYSQLLSHKKLLRNVVKLYGLLKPCYESLGEMQELINHIDELSNAADGEASEEKLDAFVNYCVSNRTFVILGY